RWAGAAVVMAERLSQHGQVEIAAAHAAVFDRVHESHEAGIRECLMRLERVFAGLVEGADLCRWQYSVEQAQHACAHLPLLFAEAEGHVRVVHASRSLMSGRTSAAKRSNCSPRRS